MGTDRARPAAYAPPSLTGSQSYASSSNETPATSIYSDFKPSEVTSHKPIGRSGQTHYSFGAGGSGAAGFSFRDPESVFLELLEEQRQQGDPNPKIFTARPIRSGEDFIDNSPYTVGEWASGGRGSPPSRSPLRRMQPSPTPQYVEAPELEEHHARPADLRRAEATFLPPSPYPFRYTTVSPQYSDDDTPRRSSALKESRRSPDPRSKKEKSRRKSPEHPRNPYINIVEPPSPRLPASGGRPPSGLGPGGNGVVFGSFGGDGDRHIRQASAYQVLQDRPRTRKTRSNPTTVPLTTELPSPDFDSGLSHEDSTGEQQLDEDDLDIRVRRGRVGGIGNNYISDDSRNGPVIPRNNLIKGRPTSGFGGPPNEDSTGQQQPDEDELDIRIRRGRVGGIGSKHMSDDSKNGPVQVQPFGVRSCDFSSLKPTISQDNTTGDCVRNAKLLAEFAQKFRIDSPLTPVKISERLTASNPSQPSLPRHMSRTPSPQREFPPKFDSPEVSYSHLPERHYVEERRFNGVETEDELRLRRQGAGGMLMQERRERESDLIDDYPANGTGYRPPRRGPYGRPPPGYAQSSYSGPPAAPYAPPFGANLGDFTRYGDAGW